MPVKITPINSFYIYNLASGDKMSGYWAPNVWLKQILIFEPIKSAFPKLPIKKRPHVRPPCNSI